MGAKVPSTSGLSLGILDSCEGHELHPIGSIDRLHSGVSVTPKPHGGAVYGGAPSPVHECRSESPGKIGPECEITSARDPTLLESSKEEKSLKHVRSIKTKKSKKRPYATREADMSKRGISKEGASATDANVAAACTPVENKSGVISNVFHAVEGFQGLFAWPRNAKHV